MIGDAGSQGKGNALLNLQVWLCLAEKTGESLYCLTNLPTATCSSVLKCAM